MNTSGGSSERPLPWGLGWPSPPARRRSPNPLSRVRPPRPFDVGGVRRERPGYQVRVIRNAWTGEIVGVRIWNPDTRAYNSTRPTGANAAEARQAFARFLGTAAAAWPGPGPGMQPPASGDELLALGEMLLDPRMLVVNLVGAAVQVAALHAGIPLLVAQAMGRLAGDEVGKLLGPDPAAGKLQALQVVDLTLSADNRAVIESALRETTDMTVDAIDKLLSPDDPPLDAWRPSPTTEPLRKSAPGSHQPDPATSSHPTSDPKPASPSSRGLREPLRPPRPDYTGVPPSPPPGWYTVPGTATTRWWDGARWTDKGHSPSPGPEPKDEGPSPMSL